MEKDFTDIYNAQAWGEGSGDGSSPENTRPYREYLEQFIRQHHIESVLDIGCGDWQFSRLVDWGTVRYTGLDCVRQIVVKNASRFSGERIQFVHADVTTMDRLPQADLVILKDVLQHWPMAVIHAFLPKLRSERYVLFVNCRTRQNRDIDQIGHFHPLNLTLPPYSLSARTTLEWHTKAAQLWCPCERWFAHSGDLGDIIYALPAIRETGGGILYLFDTPGKTTHEMNVERAGIIRPLLLLQPYVHDVVFCSSGHEDHPLNGFRQHGGAGRNLTDMHLAALGLATEARCRPWLQVDSPVNSYPVIFARSERYRNGLFPWAKVWRRYRNLAAFVGTAAEHDHFVREVGDVPFVPTKDFLELARLIAGCRLFVGNQSAPLAIAEGLRANIIAEICLRADNCRSQRMGRIDGVDEGVELPDIEALTPTPHS